jgi:hypothetical protein
MILAIAPQSDAMPQLLVPSRPTPSRFVLPLMPLASAVVAAGPGTKGVLGCVVAAVASLGQHRWILLRAMVGVVSLARHHHLQVVLFVVEAVTSGGGRKWI